MKRLHASFLVAVAVLMGAPAAEAEPTKLKCEEWHPRLGQNPDKLFAIDLDAKTCNGQPCSMSDAEFKWQEQNGRYETTINRRSGDGTLVYQGELLFSYKNCILTSGR
jgi:hypothetical protein